MDKKIKNILIVIILAILLFGAGVLFGFVRSVSGRNQDDIKRIEQLNRQLDSITAGFTEYRRQSDIIYQQFRKDIGELEYQLGIGKEIIRGLREEIGRTQDTLRKLKERNIRLEKIIFGE